MIDPDFDPLEDLHNVMMAVSAQHHQIDLLIKVINEHNVAIESINRAMTVAKNQMLLMEKRLNEINTASTAGSTRSK